MELELSSNWRKLQANLNSKSKVVEPQKEVLQKFRARRKRIKARLRNSATKQSMNLIREGPNMRISSNSRTERKDPVLTESLTLWAEDIGISAKDLTEAYGVGLRGGSIGGPNRDEINGGLSKDVDVGQYIAMDCEMVGVGDNGDRSALARVSIVNFHGIQVYDSYVRPKERVTDWRTHVSGVSPKHMITARSFDDVQKEVADLLKDRILIGHSIKYDLEAVMLSHPKFDIRDTSRFSGFRKYGAGKTPSLKILAKDVLGINIQDLEHSSIEDARAAMLLFRRHKQAFEAEGARYFQQRTINPRGSKSKPKKNGKKEREATPLGESYAPFAFILRLTESENLAMLDDALVEGF
jgi:RNA exonuclease 4